MAAPKKSSSLADLGEGDAPGMLPNGELDVYDESAGEREPVVLNDEEADELADQVEEDEADED